MTKDDRGISVDWPEIADLPGWKKYTQNIIDHCRDYQSVGQEYSCPTDCNRTLHVENSIPLQKGMGSSTALVIAVARCLLGPDCRPQAKEIEDAMNPGNSGLDFAVIWKERPLHFRNHGNFVGQEYSCPTFPSFHLIDTGRPNEATSELVAWVKSRSEEPIVKDALARIGSCTERLIAGEDPLPVIQDHHEAQVALGVVPKRTQELIREIENTGGAAKVIGAGARTGGGGMVLAFMDESPLATIARRYEVTLLPALA